MGNARSFSPPNREIAIRGARCVLANGTRAETICIKNDHISSIGEERRSTSVHPLQSTEINLSGFLVMPGLINAHDHLQFALYPRLANPPYRNYVEWGDDIHARHTDEFSRYRAVPRDIRLWWGGLRNLLCGVTTVCHHDPLWPELERDDFPIRVLRDYGWAHSVALGGDLVSAHIATPQGSAFILHACEGVDEQAYQELFELDRLGILDSETVLVHGLATDARSSALIKSRSASLILCPSSNHFLFDSMPDRALIGAISNVALGSDSPLTSEGDLLDEVRFAIRHCGISAQSAYRMITTLPAAILKLSKGEGSLAVSGVGDLIAVRDTGCALSDRLPNLSMADVELVMVGGRVHLASEEVFQRLPLGETQGLALLWIGGVTRWLRAPVGDLLRRTEAVLGAGETRLGGKPIYIPQCQEATHAS